MIDVNEITLRLTLNWEEGLILEDFFKGITPLDPDKLEVLLNMELRLAKNMEKHKRLIEMQERYELQINQIKLRERMREEIAHHDPMETLKQMAIAKGEYTDESDELDRNSHDDVG